MKGRLNAMKCLWWTEWANEKWLTKQKPWQEKKGTCMNGTTKINKMKMTGRAKKTQMKLIIRKSWFTLIKYFIFSPKNGRKIALNRKCVKYIPVVFRCRHRRHRRPKKRKSKQKRPWAHWGSLSLYGWPHPTTQAYFNMNKVKKKRDSIFLFVFDAIFSSLLLYVCCEQYCLLAGLLLFS